MFKKNTTIFNKIFTLIVLLSVISGAVIVTVTVVQYNKYLENDLIRHNELFAQLATRSIESGYFIEHIPFETLKQITESEDILFLWVVKPNGEIYLADDYKMWGKRIKDDSIGTRELVIKDSIFSKTGEKIKLIVYPLKIGKQEEQWVLYLGVSLKPLIDCRNRMIVINLISFIMIIIFVTAFSIYLTKSITNPIFELRDAAEKIAKGNLNIKIKSKSKDEIGQLAESFNKMVYNVKKSKKELKEYNKQLQKKINEKTKELQNVNVILEKKVRERTKELEKAKKNLNKKVEERTGDLKNSKNELEKAKKDLEQKNKELEQTLDDFYTMRLTMQKEMEKGQIKKENKNIKKRLDKLRGIKQYKNKK